MRDADFYDIIDSEIDKLQPIYKDNPHLKKQNGTGKKSYLFLLWFLRGYIPEHQVSKLERFITEGNDDSSCDLIFNNSDQDGNDIFYVVQAKWNIKSKVPHKKGETNVLKACITDFRAILLGNKFSETNFAFNAQYEKLLAHKKNNGKVKFIYLTLSNNSNTIQEIDDAFVTPLVSFDLIDFFKLKQQYIEINYKGIKTHNPIETPYVPKQNFDLEIKQGQYIEIPSPYRSYIVIVSPKDIYLLFEKYGNALFQKNIRNPLPKSNYNEEIKSSIENNAPNFWYFNNGITAITDEIGDFDSHSTKVVLRGIQVINGAQTVNSIYEAYKNTDDETRRKMDNDALITMRIVKTGGKDFDLKVTRYTNSQNRIEERDFHSNDEVQKRLQNDFLKYTNIWYETRRGEFRKRKNIAPQITNEALGQTYLAYRINDPFHAKNSRKLFFVSTSLNSNGLYETIFNDETRYDEMYISYYLHSFIDTKRKEMKKQIDEIDASAELSKEDEALFQYSFVQYANFDILALFKTLFDQVYDNNKEASEKLVNMFENSNTDKIITHYEFIREYLFKYLNTNSKIDRNTTYSVLFKNKSFYQDMKSDFLMCFPKQSLKEFELQET